MCGRKIGIFDEWIPAGESTKGHKGSLHQSFNNLDKAASYMVQGGVKTILVHTDQGSFSLEEYKANQGKTNNTSTLPTLPNQHNHALIHSPSNDEVDPDITFVKELLRPGTTATATSTSVSMPVCSMCRQPAGRDDSLTCSNCQWRIHFGCSRLPTYQVSNLVTTQRRFTCETCTTPKPQIAAVMSAAKQSTAIQTDTPPANTNTSGHANSQQPGSAKQDATVSAIDIGIMAVPDTVHFMTNTEDAAVPTAITSNPSSPQPPTAPATAARIDQLELTLTSMVQRLCEDSSSAHTQILAAEVEHLKREHGTTKKALDQANQLKKELKQRQDSHVCQSQCDCATKQRQLAVDSLAFDLQIEKLQKDLSAAKELTAKLENTLRKKESDYNSLYNKCQALKSEKDKAVTDADDFSKSLTEAKEHIRDLEQQLQQYNTEDPPHTWAQVVKEEVVLVKGEKDILSMFYPHPITAFGVDFTSAEHAYQYRKVIESSDCFDDPDLVRSQPSAKLAKSKANELITKKRADAWEDQSLPVMEYLVKRRKETSVEFVDALLATGNKQIIHNVASPKWGSGTDGKGQNMYGKKLMELREKIIQERQAKPQAQSPPATSTTSTSPPMPATSMNLTQGAPTVQCPPSTPYVQPPQQPVNRPQHRPPPRQSVNRQQHPPRQSHNQPQHPPWQSVDRQHPPSQPVNSRSQHSTRQSVKKPQHQLYNQPANRTSGQQSKPEVVLIGNSLLQGIHPAKLSQEFNTNVSPAYTIQEAQRAVQNLTTQPQAVIFQLTTNDVKNNNALTTAQDYHKLVRNTQAKLPSAKIIVSQAPNHPKAPYSTCISTANNNLADMLKGSPIPCVDNSHIRSFRQDKVHLSRYGSSALARSIKGAVYQALDIPPPARSPEHTAQTGPRVWNSSHLYRRSYT